MPNTEKRFISGDSRVGPLSLYSGHSFRINRFTYESVYEFLNRIKRNPQPAIKDRPYRHQKIHEKRRSPKFRPTRWIYWEKPAEEKIVKILAGSIQHLRRVRMAIRAKFFQNKVCMKELLKIKEVDLLLYLEDEESGSYELPDHLLYEILTEIREGRWKHNSHQQK